MDSLIVDLQLNSAELRKGLDEANEKLDKFGEKLHSLAEVVELKELGEMALEAAKKLGEFVIGGAEVQEKMGRMAQAAGVSVESFSQLNYAAGMSGVSTEMLGTAFKKLNSNISDAATGSTKQSALFKALGVAVVDSSGHVRNAGDVMKDLAGVFSNMEDGASKTKLELALFGKAGDEMTRMLNRGKGGLEEFSAEADRLGVTVSGPAAESAEKFMENLNRLHAVVGAVAQQVAANLTPSLEHLTTELLNNKDGAESMKGAVEFLSSLLRVMATGAVVTAAAFQILGEGIARAASAAVDFANGGKAPEDNGAAAISARLDLARGALARAKANANSADANGSPLGEVEQFIDAAQAAQKQVDALQAKLDALNKPAATESPLAPMEAALTRISAIWDTSAKAAEKASEVHKTSGDKIAAAFAEGEAAAGPFKEAMKALTAEASRLGSEVVAFGKGDMAKLDASLEGGKLALDLSKVGENAAALKATIHGLGQELVDLKIDKIATTTDYAMQRSFAAQTAGNQTRTDAFNNIGPQGSATTAKVIDTAIAGFTDFKNALAHMTAALQEQQQLQGAASTAMENGDFLAAHQATMAADESGRAAEKASKAADAFGQLAQLVVEKQAQIVASAMSVLGTIGKSGAQLAGVITAAMEGFKSGGIVGAIIAVIASLLAKLESVGAFVDQVFGGIMNLLGKLNSGLSAIFGAVMDVLTPVFNLIGPVFSFVGKILQKLGGVLEAILKPIGHIIDALTSMLGSTDTLQIAIVAIAEVFDVVALIITGVMIFLYEIWGQVLQFARDFISLFGADTQALDATIAAHKAATQKLLDNAAAITANMADPNPLQDSQGDHGSAAVGGPSRIAGRHVAGLGLAANNAANSLNNFSSSLTNVPQGFKYALDAFNAMAGPGALDPNKQHGGDHSTHVTVQGSVISGQELVDLINAAQKKKIFRQHGVGG